VGTQGIESELEGLGESDRGALEALEARGKRGRGTDKGAGAAKSLKDTEPTMFSGIY